MALVDQNQDKSNSIELISITVGGGVRGTGGIEMGYAFQVSVVLLCLLFFDNACFCQISFDSRTQQIMDNYESGDSSISFESVKIELHGYGVSECDTDNDDLTVTSSWKYKYSCRTTLLVKDPIGIIHKFSALACRRGFSGPASRMNSAAADDNMLNDYQNSYKRAVGSADPGYFTKVRSSTHCVPGRENPLGPEDASTLNDAKQGDDSAPADQSAPHPKQAHYTILNNDRYDVSIQFFAGEFGEASGLMWPNNRGWWTLGTKRSYTYVLDCEPGTLISFSAWRDHQSVEWGAGRMGLKTCGNCSVSCGDNGYASLGDGGDDQGPPPATFLIGSNDKHIIDIKYFSRTRSGQSWAGTPAFSGAGSHADRLSCQPEEQICFGAWRRFDPSKTWGVGPDGTSGCNSCCIVCGAMMATTLSDAGDDPQPTESAQPIPEPQSSGITGGDVGAAASVLGGILGAIPRTGGGAVMMHPPRPSSGSTPVITYTPSGISH